jgi:hypothetical protein
MDYKLIDNVEFDGIDYTDYPDFCDAYISSADYNGIEMTEEQLNELNDDVDLVYELLTNYIH